jgi:DNA-binding LacI/PurR family transcriptional regulator
VYAEIFERLRFLVEHEASKVGARLKVVDYTNWDDPVVGETLKAFDGIFLIPLSEEVPRNIQTMLAQSEVPLVAFEQNLTSRGIPSILSTPEIFVQYLLDYLEQIGHKNIHCVNTQNFDQVIQSRVQQWEIWNIVHGGSGQLIQKSVERYGRPMEMAHQLMSEFLKTNTQKNMAFLCLTEPCAIGVQRACWDVGLVPGKDVSIATFDSGLSKYVYPALTCIEFPDLSPYIGLCLKWMMSKNKQWAGPLMLQPKRAEIFEGGSCRKV